MDDVLTIEAHGSSYRIADPGGLLGKPLRAGNPYEARVLEHIWRQQLDGLAIDIGANVGNHTLWLAAVCGLDVYAIEPIEFPALGANVALNPALAGRITIGPFAAGEEEGFATPLDRMRLAPGAGTVPVLTIDSLLLTNVALIKCDVEGMEPQALAGALDTIARDRPIVYAEAWDQAAHGRVADVLEPLGFLHTKTFGATPLEEWQWCG